MVQQHFARQINDLHSFPYYYFWHFTNLLFTENLKSKRAFEGICLSCHCLLQKVNGNMTFLGPNMHWGICGFPSSVKIETIRTFLKLSLRKPQSIGLVQVEEMPMRWKTRQEVIMSSVSSNTSIVLFTRQNKLGQRNGVRKNTHSENRFNRTNI